MKYETRISLILLSVVMLILFSGVILGLVFGTARFQRICAEAQVDILTGNYKVK